MLEKINKINRIVENSILYQKNYPKPPKPFGCTLELTYRCTLRCNFCDRWKVGYEDKANELTTEELKRVMDELKELGLLHLGFTGGEPLLREDLFELAEYAKSKGFKLSLNTNGFLINEKNVDKIVELFDGITISIDSINEETHDYLRGVKGSWKNAIKAVKLINEKRRGITSVQMVVTRQNISEVGEYVKFFQKIGIIYAFQPVHDNPSNLFNIKDKELTKFEYKKLKEEWEEATKDLKLTPAEYYSSFPEFLCKPQILLNNFVCFAATHNFHIGPYGNVFPCENLRNSQGNVKEESLIQIWENMQNLRRWISSNNRNCICWYRCTAAPYINISKRLKKIPLILLVPRIKSKMQ